MFKNISVRRVDNNDTSTYKVSLSAPLKKAISNVEQEIIPSAPPAPWYYYSYPSEVIIKAHTVLHETWYKLNDTEQKKCLDFYLHHYNNNDLD